jgi:hypothetical protein
MSAEPLIEQLADAEHASWARWMDYLFSVSKRDHNGSCTIPPELAHRWERQAATPYADLSEREKESDRAEVWHILPLIDAAAQAARREGWEGALDLLERTLYGTGVMNEDGERVNRRIRKAIGRVRAP